MTAFINYCMENPILTAILIGTGVLMLLLSGMILAMPDNDAPPANKTLPSAQTSAPKAKEKLPAQTVAAPTPTSSTVQQAPIVEQMEEKPAPQAVPKVEDKPEPATETVQEIELSTDNSIQQQPMLDKKEDAQTVEKITQKAEETPVVSKAKEESKPTSPAKKTKAAEKKTETATQAEEKAATPAKKTTAKKKTTQKNPTPDLKNQSKEQDMLLDDLNVENVTDFYEEDETDRIAKYSGRWVICRIVTEERSASHKKSEEDEPYFFELHASNGEKLFSSEEYPSYNGALRGIETHKTNILRGNFKIIRPKKGEYMFKLLSGKNLILCMGESYSTKVACEKAIESTKRFAQTAVLDENIQDHVVKITAEDAVALPPLPNGYNGKWIISTHKSLENEDLYYFELFANDGEKLLCSEDYTTYVGAVNGIQTHKSNITDGNFQVTLTKRGDYVYKLLNKNGQLLCLSERYQTKAHCLHAVELIKCFAVNSAVLTNIKL